jgi:hypothetical protein
MHIQLTPVMSETNAMFSCTTMAGLTAASDRGVLADRRGIFAGAGGRCRIDPAFRSAFLHSKMHIARTHPARDLPRRNKALFDFARRLGSLPASLIHQPCPGGVGYGPFYRPEYQSAFRTGTEILWQPLCPAEAAGNLGNYLYVTATNRAAAGAETLISYDAAGKVSFRIYDWAHPPASRWQLDAPLGALQRYRITQTCGGQRYEVLPIWNSTARMAPGAWCNRVCLFDLQAGQWVLVYRHDYARRDDRQRGMWVGSWGPIMETFQSFHADTNPFGSLGTQLRGCDRNGAWTAWTDLTGAVSQMRSDNLGFQPVLLEENHDWIVAS